jgi:hypothetical protein
MKADTDIRLRDVLEEYKELFEYVMDTLRYTLRYTPYASKGKILWDINSWYSSHQGTDQHVYMTLHPKERCFHLHSGGIIHQGSITAEDFLKEVGYNDN